MWPKNCPECGNRIIPIVYGYLGPGMIRKAERGEVHIGGCLINQDNPRYYCNTCAEEQVRASE